jgi:hypothetical protein
VKGQGQTTPGHRGDGGAHAGGGHPAVPRQAVRQPGRASGRLARSASHGSSPADSGRAHPRRAYA